MVMKVQVEEEQMGEAVVSVEVVVGMVTMVGVEEAEMVAVKEVMEVAVEENPEAKVDQQVKVGAYFVLILKIFQSDAIDPS